MRCDDCLKPSETLYWVDRPGWLVCAACLPAHFRPMIGPWMMSAHAGFRLETKGLTPDPTLSAEPVPQR